MEWIVTTLHPPKHQLIYEEDEAISLGLGSFDALLADQRLASISAAAPQQQLTQRRIYGVASQVGSLRLGQVQALDIILLRPGVVPPPLPCHLSQCRG